MKEDGNNKLLTLHLDKKLRLDSPGRLGFVVGTGRTQRVDLINEDNAGLVLAGKFEEVPDQLLGFTQPLRNKIGRGDGEERGVVRFRRNGLG